MLVDEMSNTFVKKMNYSRCPIKKRPVNFIYAEELAKPYVKDDKVDIIDENSEPENLCTKPQDLSSRTSAPSAVKRSRSPSPVTSESQSVTRSPSPVATQQRLYKPYYPSTAITPPHSETPVHPVAKKARVEVIHQSESYASSPVVDPMNHYAWSRVPAPIYPSQYLYPSAYRYASDMYSGYPLPGYPLSSPEHQSVSPSPPHSTTPSNQRPIARPWTSPDPCALSPTNSLGSVSLHSPPPATPEDLSSDSGRSSAGSVSAESKLSPSDLTSSPRYQCPDCGKSYSTYSGLSKHQQFHCAAAEGQAKKTFTCKDCDKVYMTLGALKMHIRTHTLPCKCHLCGKAFSRPWLLQGHIRTHTGEKPFSCQHCQRAFADRSNLRAHLQTHSDVKKYSCQQCSKTFSRMSLLSKHQEQGCPSAQGCAAGHQVYC